MNFKKMTDEDCYAISDAPYKNRGALKYWTIEFEKKLRSDVQRQELPR